jgi:hypothetical protein
LLPFLNIGTTPIFTHKKGELPVSKFRLKMWRKRAVNISASEIYGILKRSIELKSE